MTRVALMVAFWLATIAFTVFGYVTNIIKLIGMLGDDNITTMFVARVVGLFVFPLGIVLGYF